MEHHLEQDVAQLLLQVLRVLLVDGLHRLIRLLQHIPADALVGLLPGPRDIPGRPEQLHDAQQVLDPIGIYILKIYHNLASFARYFLRLF